jgi:hypothetical protein
VANIAHVTTATPYDVADERSEGELAAFLNAGKGTKITTTTKPKPVGSPVTKRRPPRHETLIDGTKITHN